MQTTIENLRTISERCHKGRPLDSALSSSLAERLDRFLAHECGSVEDALELRQPRGGVPWWLVEAMYKRDRALRQLADLLDPYGSASGRARVVRRLTVRYADTAWPVDQTGEVMPEAYPGTACEFLWNAFKAGAPMPLGERQLRNILSI